MLTKSSSHTPQTATERAAEHLVAFASRYTKDFPVRLSPLRPRPAGEGVVLVTGTTGNFGCELLESLLMDDDVDIVYAVNRCGTQAFNRQKAAFQAKDMDDDLLNSPKFKLVEGDLKLPGLGVEQSVYNEICNSVTHIIHNAWQVNFNLTVESFDPLLKSLRSLVDLALSSPYLDPPKIQFVSSISVFQNYIGAPPVPEEPIDPEFALGSGYGESKWVAERLLLEVAAKTDVPIQIIRLAQICGDRSGFWSPSEWFPAIVKSAGITHCLPELDGDAAFIPASPAAQALVEMRSSNSTILHLTHPRPARLRALLDCAAREIGVPLKPFNVWLKELSEFEEKLRSENSGADYIRTVRANPALMLLDFFNALRFTHGAEMTVLMPISTENAVAASSTLDNLAELGDDMAMLWLSAWRDHGFL